MSIVCSLGSFFPRTHTLSLSHYNISCSMGSETKLCPSHMHTNEVLLKLIISFRKCRHKKQQQRQPLSSINQSIDQMTGRFCNLLTVKDKTWTDENDFNLKKHKLITLKISIRNSMHTFTLKNHRNDSYTLSHNKLIDDDLVRFKEMI